MPSLQQRPFAADKLSITFCCFLVPGLSYLNSANALVALNEDAPPETGIFLRSASATEGGNFRNSVRDRMLHSIGCPNRPRKRMPINQSISLYSTSFQLFRLVLKKIVYCPHLNRLFRFLVRNIFLSIFFSSLFSNSIVEHRLFRQS